MNTSFRTVQTRAFTHDVTNDQASAGGVHHVQIRRTPYGWEKRIKQSNGRFFSYSHIQGLTDSEARALISRKRK